MSPFIAENGYGGHIRRCDLNVERNELSQFFRRRHIRFFHHLHAFLIGTGTVETNFVQQFLLTTNMGIQARHLKPDPLCKVPH